MNAISEAEFTDYLQNKVVKRINIVQSDAGKYRIVIALTWKKGEWDLLTTRGKPRQWASLDRLVRHLHEQYGGALPKITLTINK